MPKTPANLPFVTASQLGSVRPYTAPVHSINEIFCHATSFAGKHSAFYLTRTKILDEFLQSAKIEDRFNSSISFHEKNNYVYARLTDGKHQHCKGFAMSKEDFAALFTPLHITERKSL